MNRTDSFNRADSASSLGTPSDAGTAWSALYGTWGVSGNAAYCPSNTVFGVAALEASAADADVQVTYRGPDPAANVGPAARVTDADNGIYLYNYAGTFYLVKNVAGAFTVLDSAAGSTADGSVLRVRCQGDQVTAYLNGSPLIGPVTETFNQSATKHGLFNGGLYGTANRFDDFSVTDLAGAGSAAERESLPRGLGRGLTRGLA